MLGVFRPSGGLLYHWRAHRYRHLWRPFVNGLEGWLKSWPQNSRELILIGPSGGYTLSSAWLQDFKKIYAYDVDPLAPHMFKRQHPQVDVEFKNQDMFWSKKQLSWQPLTQTLAARPQAAVLFSNVLGQVLLEGKATEEEWLKHLSQLRSHLEGRAWASYHDAWTFEGKYKIDHLTTGSWSEGLEPHILEWQLTPRSLHQIYCLRGEAG